MARGGLVLQVGFDIDEAPVAVLAPKVRVFNLRKLFLGVCRLQGPRLLVSLDVHVVTVVIGEVTDVVTVAVENRVAHAQNAFVVQISARVLYKLLEARKGLFVVGTITVAFFGLVLHAVNQRGEDLEAGRAGVVNADKVLIALCQGTEVGVAAYATVETAWDSIRRAVDLQLSGRCGIADVPVQAVLMLLQQVLAAEK